MHPRMNTLPVASRAAASKLLNELLADLIDLQLQAKQAHWNVKGPSFIALHELFDQVSEAVESLADHIAERMTSLGGRADGTLKTVAELSSLPDYPLEIVRGRDHVQALSEALAAVTRQARLGIVRAEELVDAGTADLLTELLRSIDQKLWFVEAHLRGDQ